MFKTKVKVRYNETDQMGVVYHSNYYHWFEIGRTELLDELGLPYKEIEQMGTMLPVIESHCVYKNPAKYADELTVFTKLVLLKGTRMKFEYNIMREADNRLIAVGDTVHTFIDNSFKPVNPKKHNPKVFNMLSGVLNK